MTTDATGLPVGANLLSRDEDLKVVTRDAPRPATDGAVVTKRASAWRRRLLLATGFVLAASTGGAYAYAHRGLEDTDDAQLEGDLINVSARVPGKVARLLVSDDQIVNAGDVVAELETDQLTEQLASAKADQEAAEATLQAARTQLALTEKTAQASLTQASGGLALSEGALTGSRAGVEQARANVRAARSKVDLAELELSRSEKLLATGAVQQDDVDTRRNVVDSARAELEVATATVVAREAAIESALGDVRASGGKLDAARTLPEQVANARALVRLDEAKRAQANAALELARLNLSYAEVRAPVRGQVTRRAVQLGHMVTPDVPLLSLVPLENVWVVANFKEDQVARMGAGRHAEVKIDTYGSRVFRAHVDTLGATSGARLSLMPAENASGNYVKVVQRVPVRVVFDGPVEVPLRPGTSADVTVDVR
jgi:membrane fusion protein (multidrug efflux system)